MRMVIVCLGIIGALFVSSTGRASTIQASSFASCGTGDGSTVGTAWPGCAIQDAMSSAVAGDTVLVDSGYWSVTTAITDTTALTLLGQGGAGSATLIFTGSGRLVFGSTSSFVSNIKLSGLTLNGGSASGGNPIVEMDNCLDCTFTENIVFTIPNASEPSVLTQGGANMSIASNSFIAGGSADYYGGNQLQINPLGISTLLPVNSGFDISGNYFDSVGVYEIGMSNIRIHDNYIVDTTVHWNNNIAFAPPYSGIAYNIAIYNNFLNVLYNFASIQGTPQDPGGTGSIDGLNISGNVMNGTSSVIAVTTNDTTCLASCSGLQTTTDVVISNNIMKSFWPISATIYLDGGLTGSVQDVVVQGNMLLSGGSGYGWSYASCIHYDANTLYINDANNSSPGGWGSGCEPG
jgi:hypothetical protein